MHCFFSKKFNHNSTVKVFLPTENQKFTKTNRILPRFLPTIYQSKRTERKPSDIERQRDFCTTRI